VFLVGWAPALSWAGFLWNLSSQSAPSAEVTTLGGTTNTFWAHFGAFAVLAVLFLTAIRRSFSQRWAYPLAFALSVLYAIIDEAHQGPVAQRNASLWDGVVDGLGAAAAMVGMWLTVAALSWLAARRGSLGWLRFVAELW
jgi:VanZ family protein